MTTNKYRQNDWFMKLSKDAKIKNESLDEKHVIYIV